MDAAGSARLTESIAPSRAVTATLSRDEIVDAMGAGELPELHLEVEQRGAGHDERGSIAITWSREQLERILAGAKGDEIVLTFDRDDLAYALADVEAHGLRERALVFAVVVTGAIGTSAGVATAMPAADAGVGTGAGAAGVALTDVSSGGGYTAALQEPATAPALTDASSGAGYAAAAAIESDAASSLTDASSGGGYAAAAAIESDAASSLTDASSGGGYAAAAAIESDAASSLTDASSGGGYAAAAAIESDAASTLTDASSGSGYAAAAVAEDSAASSMLTDASSGGGYPAAATADDGAFFDVRSPDPADAALLGGVALAIAAAGFAARRSRDARPA